MEISNPAGGVSFSESEARVTHLRGSMARMVRASVAGAIELEAWSKIVASLDPDARALAEADLELPDWVPIEAVTAWIAAFASANGQLPRGSAIADQLLDHAHPWIERNLDPRFALETFPKLFQHYHRGGVARLVEATTRRGLIELWAFVPYPGWHDYLLPKVLRRTLERCGAMGVKFRILPQAPGDPHYHHRYEITWGRVIRT